MADPRFLRHFAQAKAVDTLPGKYLNTSLNQGILQVTMMIFFSGHEIIVLSNLDSVKISIYNLYTVKFILGGGSWSRQVRQYCTDPVGFNLKLNK